MSDNATQIREAKNTIEVEGWLKEVALSEENDTIRGHITISTGDNEEHRISVFENKYAKKDEKKENITSAYKGLKTIMETSVSIASLLAAGANLDFAKEQAWKVACTGNTAKLSRNEFYDPTGSLVSRPTLVGRYFRQVTPDKFNPRAIFNVECFFTALQDETDRDGVKTGRVKVEVLIPTFGGRVMPFSFVADDDVGEYLMDNYEINKTGRVHGDIIGTVISEAIQHPGFGTPRVEVKNTKIQEFKITGGDESQYSEEDNRSYTIEQIKAAIDVRENTYLPSLLAKSQNKGKGQITNNSRPVQNGFSASRANAPTTTPTFTF